MSPQTKTAKRLSRKTVGFALATLLLIFFAASYRWQKFYYDGPKSAFYQLASALEREDKARLKQLTAHGAESQLLEMAQPYGGIANFGRHLRQSARVNCAIHMIMTVDVFATVEGREIMIMFTRARGRWVASTVFFTGRYGARAPT